MSFALSSSFCLLFVLTAHLAEGNILPESVSTVLDDSNLQQDESSITKRDTISGNNPGGVTVNVAGDIKSFNVNGNSGVNVTPAVAHVAFQATLTSGRVGPNYANGAIKFNDVTLNLGNAYNPSTGKFTAPVNGVYQFSVSYLQENGYTSHVRVLVDSTVVSDLHANHKNYDQLSKTLFIKLTKSQTVWIRLEKSSIYAIYGSSRYTTFGGYLLFKAD